VDSIPTRAVSDARARGKALRRRTLLPRREAAGVTARAAREGMGAPSSSFSAG